MSLQITDTSTFIANANEISTDTVYTKKADVHQLFFTNNQPIAFDGDFFSAEYDTDSSIFWLRMHPNCPPKFTPELVKAFREFQTSFKNYYLNPSKSNNSPNRPRYLVFTSEIANTFSLGGDLPYFYALIKNGDRKSLKAYARACVELVYQNSIAMDLPMTTIALVKGNAMGGGMEAALAANVLIAERQVEMGLPEVLFNMFPGMGAYQFLSRRLSPVDAEKMIMSGRTYKAEELYDMGVVDVLADEGKGDQAVNRYVSRHKKSSHAARALHSAIRVADPVTRESLMSVIDIWVEAAMTLDERDLGRMQYLIRAQQRRGL